MSKRYICSRCGKQSDTNLEFHLMGHKVHPSMQDAFWMDLDLLTNMLNKRGPRLMTKAEDDPDGPIDDPEVL